MTDDIPNPTTSDGVPQADPASISAPEPGQAGAAPPADDATPSGARRSSSADVGPHRPEYKGAELDPERGPGLGCFWFQVFVLGFFIVLIPIGINLAWPYEVLAILLFVVIGLLLLTGQTVIFLLRLVAADRRAHGRRRPLASPTKTVGELEDVHRVAHAVGGEAWVGAGQPGAAPHGDATELPREPAAPGGVSANAAAGAVPDQVADGGSMIRDRAPYDLPEMPSDAPAGPSSSGEPGASAVVSSTDGTAGPGDEPRGDGEAEPGRPSTRETTTLGRRGGAGTGAEAAAEDAPDGAAAERAATDAAAPDDGEAPAPAELGDAPAGLPAPGASAGGVDPEPEEPDPGVRQ